MKEVTIVFVYFLAYSSKYSHDFKFNLIKMLYCMSDVTFLFSFD